MKEKLMNINHFWQCIYNLFSGVQLLSSNVTDDSENTFDPDGLRTSNADDTNDAGSIENIVDSDEASALHHNKSIVEIYSNSWGPIDGYGFEGPEAITEEVLRNGVTYVSLNKHIDA